MDFPVDERLVSEKGIRLDNSKRSTGETCMRKLYFAHYRGLTSAYGNTALRFGSTFHGAMKGHYTGVIEKGWDNPGYCMQLASDEARKAWDESTDGFEYIEDYRTFENCMKLYLAYLAENTEERFHTKILATELPFEYEFPVTEADKYSLVCDIPIIVHTGKIDLQLELNGIPWTQDFKSTGWAIESVKHTLSKNMQYVSYCFAQDHVLDYEPEGSLASIAHCSARKNKAGEYGNLKFDFARVPQIYTQHDLASWKESYLHFASRLYHCWKHNYWPVDYDGCFKYNKQCAFYGLCQQNCHPQDVNTEGYTVHFWDVTDGDD